MSDNEKKVVSIGSKAKKQSEKKNPRLKESLNTAVFAAGLIQWCQNLSRGRV